MDIDDFTKFVAENFGGVTVDHPWESDPSYTVLRHSDNRKWFALIFDASIEQLLRLKDDNLVREYASGERIDVVNLKVEPDMIEDIVQLPGVLPAFHMNRRHWITALLDGSVDLNTLAPLVEMSYNSTMKKRRAGKTL